MLTLKSRTALALAFVLAMASVAPALAGGSQSAPLKMSGQEWLQRMEKNRADQPIPGAPLWVSVKVNKADLPGHALTISHGAIPKIHMPAMTMTFPVVDPTHLSMLHKGDPIDIEVADVGGEVKILDFRMNH
jgi:Cu/Ag efflux protein CusF